MSRRKRPDTYCEQCGNLIIQRVRPDRAKHFFCGKTCYGKWKSSHRDEWTVNLPKQGIGENNSNWKGDGVSEDSGRNRAQRWFQLKPCEICGSEKSERHHRDGNTSNNTLENIQFLCRKHHMEVDGRMVVFVNARGGRRAKAVAG